jgi:hypothetical protein
MRNVHSLSTTRPSDACRPPDLDRVIERRLGNLNRLALGGARDSQRQCDRARRYLPWPFNRISSAERAAPITGRTMPGPLTARSKE